MFQLSSFCYITPSLQARPALGDTSTKCTHLGVLWSLRVEGFRLQRRIPGVHVGCGNQEARSSFKGLIGTASSRQFVRGEGSFSSMHEQRRPAPP